MDYIIWLFAAFMIFTGAIMLLNPRPIFDPLAKRSHSLGLHIVAVLVRVLLGVVLLVAAPTSKFPLVLAIIGWISIAAGVALAVIGRKRFMRLMDWMLKVIPRNAHFVGLAAIIFGAFIGYAVV